MVCKRIFIFVIFILHIHLVYSQNSVAFYNDNLKKALDIAKIEGKDVFVDAWASWCIPCKKQDKVFYNADVIEFLNKNFVSLKINMDSEEGKRMNYEYEVVFLPTLLVLNSKGEIKLRTERFLDKNQLLYFLKDGKEREGKVFQSTLSTVPFGNNKVLKNGQNNSDYETQLGLEVIYDEDPTLLSEADKLAYRITYFYNETYLRLQNMDDSYKDTFEAYLKTQSDWSTEKNMIFIYNFISSVKSNAFEYIVSNMELFENQFGKVNLDRSIQFLIYNRLNNGFPRATLEEASRLYSIIYDDDKARGFANHYNVQKLYSDSNFVQFIKFVEESYNGQHSEISYQMAEVYFYRLHDLKQALKWVENAIVLNDKTYKYYLLKSEIYLSKNDTEKAMILAILAKEIIDQHGLDNSELEALMHRINAN